MKKILKVATLSLLASSYLVAGSFNAQAEKDRLALIKYMEHKFGDPVNSGGFPYTPEDELKNNFIKGIKWQDFSKGSYAYAKDRREQWLEIIDIPPYEDNVDSGEELYNSVKGLKQCFPDPAQAAVDYPKFDTSKNEVVTLTVAINDCLVANGQKKWKMTKGKMTDLQAYFVNSAKEAEKVIDVKIPNEEAAKAYEAGKKYYYSQRGYLKLSCANCHVQGAGKRVRREYLSPLLGAATHFPVYRLKWQGLGTMERRFKGCIKDTGQNPPKLDSKEMRNLIYFISYMSNGMKIDGPDVRK